MEMIKTLFSQHTNVHNSCCGNYAFMAEKKILPLSFNILLCYGRKKSFYMVKNTTKHPQYNTLLLWHWKHMVKIDNGIKFTKSKTTSSSQQPLTFKARRYCDWSYKRKWWSLSYLRLVKTFKNGIADTFEKSENKLMRTLHYCC